MKFSHILSLCLSLFMLISCGEPKFKVSGDISGASDESLLLEKADFHGRWIPVDSTRTNSSGHFSISAPAPASPEIYRLSLGDRFIYLPVDSVETLTITSSAKAYGKDFAVDGSQNARNLTAFEHALQGLSASDSISMGAFKKDVYAKYLKDAKGSVVSYYILTKIFNGKPLYDPENPTDAKYYAAVATQFDEYRPSDPHGKMVKDITLQAMRRHNAAAGKQTVYNANEISLIDIDLPDVTGKSRKLSELVGHGKPVLLVFSLMNEPESPALNRRLRDFYQRGMEIYQVSVDAGQYEWREAAKNLPWVTVIDPQGTSSTALLDYNVQSLPALFIYNAAGELTDRPQSFEDIKF